VTPAHERETAIDKSLACNAALLEERLEVHAAEDPSTAQPGLSHSASVGRGEGQLLREPTEARAPPLEVVEPGHVRREAAVGDHGGAFAHEIQCAGEGLERDGAGGGKHQGPVPAAARLQDPRRALHSAEEAVGHEVEGEAPALKRVEGGVEGRVRQVPPLGAEMRE